MSSSTAPPSDTRAPGDDGRRPAPPSPDRIRVLAPGLYAWLLTVAHPVLSPGVSLAARLFAGLAVAVLLGGVLLAARRPALARPLGIYAFVGCSLFTWCLAGPAIAVGRVDAARSALGVLGWVIYAFGWGRSRGPRVPEDDPNVVAGAPLAPRARLSRVGAPVVALAVFAALGLEALAFRVERGEPALFAHAAAVACALFVLGAGSRIALGLGTRRTLGSATTRLNALAAPLAALAVVLGLGLVWAAFSR